MVDLADCINDVGLLIGDFSADSLFFDVPEINGIFVSSDPFFEEFQIEDFLAIKFVDGFLCL